MELFEAIYTRQSIDKVRPDPIPREMIEKLLDAAVQAPNHFKVRPWRFIVISGHARNRLGDVMAESLLQRVPDCSINALDSERARPLRSPVIVAVGVDKPEDPRVVEVENICAAAAAVQNLLLAAHALGLGAKWRTGSAATDPRVKSFLGLDPDQHLIALVYIGYPQVNKEPVQRPSFIDRTTWMDD